MTPLLRSRALAASILIGAIAATLAAADKAPPVYQPPSRPGRPARAPVVFVTDTVVLARVDAKTIYVRDYIERYYNSYMEYRPASDSTGRREFLERMINK